VVTEVFSQSQMRNKYGEWASSGVHADRANAHARQAKLLRDVGPKLGGKDSKKAQADAAKHDELAAWHRAEGTRKAKGEMKQEAQGSTAQPALLRGRRKVESMVSLAEAHTVDTEARKVRCIVIREGMGNSRDKHYYGREAMQDLAQLINGSKAYINHQTEAQARERPENDLWSLAGYWCDGTLIEVNGKMALEATLVCDESEAGQVAMAKALHAVQYAQEFPGLAEVYAGVSINGDGETEPREVNTPEGVAQVNYVTRVTALPSADIVTRPAREGKFLSLLEAIREADESTEVETMIANAVKEMLAKIVEAGKSALDGKLEPAKAQAIVEAEAKKIAAVTKTKAGEGEGEAEGEAEAEANKAGEGEAEAEAVRAVDGEPAHAEPDGDEPDGDEEAEAEAGKGATKREIKYTEKTVKAGEAVKSRDLSKQLAEANKTIRALTAKMNEAEVKALVEEGFPVEFAKSLVKMPADQRTAFKAMAGMMESNATAAGTTMRGMSATKEAKAGDGFMRLLEAAIR